MILATRAKFMESWLNGLDKSYRLHKWLGISALDISIVHWLAVNDPKWMVGLGSVGKAEPRQRRRTDTHRCAGSHQRRGAEQLRCVQPHGLALLQQ